MALRFGKLEDALIAAGAPSEQAAEAAEQVADVVALPHRMERRLLRVEVLVGSTLSGVGLVRKQDKIHAPHGHIARILPQP